MDTLQKEETHIKKSEVVEKLPNPVTLFTEGFAYAKNHKHFLAMLTLFPLAMITLGELQAFIPQSTFSLSVILLSILLLIVGYFLSATAALYAVCNPEDSKNNRKVYSWARKNFWALCWIYVLATLAVFGGILLFIIPGIIVSISVYLAVYAYIHEGARGTAALLRSRYLVEGKWWGVLVRVTIVTMFVSILTSLVSTFAIVINEMSGGLFIYVVLEGCIQLANAVGAIILFYAGNELYKNRLKNKPENKESSPMKQRGYTALLVVGVIAITAAIAAVVWAVQDVYKEGTFSNTPEVTVLRSELATLSVWAENRKEQTGSYVGICESARPVLTSWGDYHCSESASEWRVSVSSEEETLCIDATAEIYDTPLPIKEGLNCS